ncbi:uncharacterized protein TRIADDRAFT_60025 [Trichoplax adhaerens]|uniref:Receptor ligand binding region domain-containing protein n=1 Tax=Trichoplax adhaerens TaxID=10228 RepID=B3S737_TRIAD|nr:predicted protein [Trichoplax adhaerens]EDV21505.1 predicted protein [Trichoplax adhaerens]|eukprot:XP_002116105.1 predicted protein [Trichoplax adhaerens]
MLRVILVSVMMVLAMSPSCCALDKIELGIIGLFPKSDPESKLAAEMAVQDINNDLSMLPMVTFFLTPIEAYKESALTYDSYKMVKMKSIYLGIDNDKLRNRAWVMEKIYKWFNRKSNLEITSSCQLSSFL